MVLMTIILTFMFQNILRKQPYHIDSLIQMADFHRVNEDFQVGAEFIGNCRDFS